jgi:hypothetical protein
MKMETVCGSCTLKNFTSSITENSFPLCSWEEFPGSLHCVIKTPEINTIATQYYTQAPNKEHKLQGSPNSRNIKMLPPDSHIMTFFVSSMKAS